MRSSEFCSECLRKHQVAFADRYPDDEKKEAFLKRVDEILSEYVGKKSSPWLLYKLESDREEFYKDEEDYAALKSFFNQYLLKIEERLWKEIEEQEDPMAMCVRFVCAGNYIDCSAVENVNEKTLDEFLSRARFETVDEGELQRLKRDLAGAKTLAYLLDNCGEIVLDKLFIRQIRETYPDLKIYAFVKGGIVINDAAMEDAVEVGLDQMVEVVDTGSFVPGTDLGSISEEAREILENADVVISKGQANFESLSGEGVVNPYFLFLVKCERFVKKFDQELFTSVFRKEDEIA